MVSRRDLFEGHEEHHVLNATHTCWKNKLKLKRKERLGVWVYEESKSRDQSKNGDRKRQVEASKGQLTKKESIM